MSRWIKCLAYTAALIAVCITSSVHAADDPLPSWNDGPVKQAIVDFVKATTDSSSPNFVSPEARIATFDQDGTLWVEHPMYTQVLYCLDRVPAVVAQKPELKDKEPFKTVLSGDRKAIAKLSIKDLETILVATLTRMPLEEFDAEAKKWIAAATDPRWKRPYTDLTYQPMRYCITCATMATRPTSRRAAVRTSSGSTPIRPMVYRPSRWSARQAERPTAMTKMAGRS